MRSPSSRRGPDRDQARVRKCALPTDNLSVRQMPASWRDQDRREPEQQPEPMCAPVSPRVDNHLRPQNTDRSYSDVPAGVMTAARAHRLPTRQRHRAGLGLRTRGPAGGGADQRGVRHRDRNRRLYRAETVAVGAKAPRTGGMFEGVWVEITKVADKDRAEDRENAFAVITVRYADGNSCTAERMTPRGQNTLGGTLRRSTM